MYLKRSRAAVENKTCENVSRSFNQSADEERFAETPIKGYEW
jgi:hypothetical protein